ncbi:MAG: hypothetical protein LBU43_13010 [Candidatus Accumulibacter sp.]|nr:hypothetical protein [Accumulibacter sp.]
MKPKLIVTTLALVCLFLAGCAHKYADVPAPTRFKNSDQQKLQAANHWQLIADNFAGQLATSLGSQLGGRALYVPQPGGEQAFVGGFRELLITSLVDKGVPVATSASGALVADVRYNIYKFHPGRVAETSYYGEATMLAAGLWALGGVASISGGTPGVTAGTKLVSAAALFDGFRWLSDEGQDKGRFADPEHVPQSEILLTVSVADAGRFVSRYSSIYYTSDADAALYWERPRTGSRLPVKGDCEERQLCAR